MLVMKLLQVFLLTCSFCAIPSKAEIREFNGPVEADSTYIHFSEGYIVAPGYIDLSGLKFTTFDDDEGIGLGSFAGEEREPTNDGENPDDADHVDDDDIDTPRDSEGGGNRRDLGQDGFDQKDSTVSLHSSQSRNSCAEPPSSRTVHCLALSCPAYSV